MAAICHRHVSGCLIEFSSSENTISMMNCVHSRIFHQLKGINTINMPFNEVNLYDMAFLCRNLTYFLIATRIQVPIRNESFICYGDLWVINQNIINSK